MQNNGSFDELKTQNKAIDRKDFEKQGALDKLLKPIPVYGSKRLKEKHSRAGSVIN